MVSYNIQEVINTEEETTETTAMQMSGEIFAAC